MPPIHASWVSRLPRFAATKQLSAFVALGEPCRGLLSRGLCAASLSGTRDAYPSPAVQAAVVGSGPAGMYTAQKLLKEYGDNVMVHVLDRLPTPFGLVRSGVAPDHAETKNVVNQFNGVLMDPRVRYFGNVHVGKDVTLGELREMYHAVVLAYGTEADRRLGIPGEDLKGVFSARDFVWWMNAHPDCTSLPVDLSRVRSVAILGLGNVALDCARVLLQSPAGPLASTDISGRALAELRRSSVESVHIIGRRGVAQAQFTGKELKEMLFEIPGVRTEVSPEQLLLNDLDKAEVASSRQKKRIVHLISKAAKEQQRADDGRSLHFHFLRSPTEILADSDGRAHALTLERNVLIPGADGGEQRAKGTGKTEQLPVDLVLTCIGYRGLPMAGLPFDERRGLIPNTHGRVDGHTGVYVAGWIGRGPSGKVGTNLADANDVVELIKEDFSSGCLNRQDDSAGLEEVMKQRAVTVVDIAAWQQIDRVEVFNGQEMGKVREKFHTVEEMIATCRG